MILVYLPSSIFWNDPNFPVYIYIYISLLWFLEIIDLTANSIWTFAEIFLIINLVMNSDLGYQSSLAIKKKSGKIP